MADFSSDFGNILDQLKTRAALERQDQGKYGTLNAIAEPLAKESIKLADEGRLENKELRKFQRELQKEGYKLFTPDIKSRILENDPDVKPEWLDSYDGVYVKEDEISKQLAQKKLAQTFEDPGQRAAAEVDPAVGAKAKFSDELSKSKKQFVGTTADGNSAIIFNPVTSEFSTETLPTPGGVNPRNKARLPAEKAKELADFNVVIKQLDRVETLYKPDFVGPIKGRAGKVKQVTGIGATKERALFLSNLNSIRNQLIYLRSGKQINEKEYERLLSELPDENKSSKDFEPKLNNFKKVFNDLLEERTKSFQQSGFIVPDSGVNIDPLGVRK